MRAVFVLMQFYPAIAVPSAFGFLQLALHFKRQKQRQMMIIMGVLAAVLLSSATGWLVFRGDLHSIRWAKNIVETFSLSQHD